MPCILYFSFQPRISWRKEDGPILLKSHSTHKENKGKSSAFLYSENTKKFCCNHNKTFWYLVDCYDRILYSFCLYVLQKWSILKFLI
jgi:hypothetical protein